MDEVGHSVRRSRSVRETGSFDLGFLLSVVAVIAAAGWFWVQVQPALDDIGRPTLPHASPAALVGGTSTPAPSASPSLAPSASAAESPSASPSASPFPSASPSPVRAAVDLKLEAHPADYFSSEATKVMCADAAIQITVNLLDRPARPNLARSFQDQIAAMAVGLTTAADSRNGGWGPDGMAAAISQLSGVEYELRSYATRDQAVRASAIAVGATNQPVIWLAWRGAHAWVIDGFRATADPVQFRDARISGVYVLDPWYPRVSNIWGPSDPPGTFQNAAEMTRNFLPWKRPEGAYPGRDGRFLVIVPAAAPKG